ncbi:putative recombination endonuclease VII protein [Rhizobium phage RHph_X2_25]|nr:putative recombination endonuclease VII protein [Rhizobium phage RHph_X2_25]
MEALEKECSRCREVKPLSDFYKQKGCKFGLSPRCKECAKRERAEKYKESPDKAKAAAAEWRKNNPDKVIEYEQKAAEKRAEAKRQKIASRKGKTAAQVWRDENRDKQRAWSSASQKKRLSTAKGKLEAAMRNGIVRGLVSGGKEGRRTFEILEFTTDELKLHLESLFSEGMSWENYGNGPGKWSIDHVLPLAAHDYETVSDPDFNRAWALSNLQPMWSTENSAKGPRISEKYGNAHLLRPANDNEPSSHTHRTKSTTSRGGRIGQSSRQQQTHSRPPW